MNDWQPSEWDRGYEAGRQAGLVEAEERIIKLLARLYPDVDWDLALIKGEQK